MSKLELTASSQSVNQQNDSKSKNPHSKTQVVLVNQILLEELKFQRKRDVDFLGEGGNTRVYRGLWKNKPVAIKVFRGQPGETHKRELEHTAELIVNKMFDKLSEGKTINLVRLLGVVIEESLMALVMEYMPKNLSLYQVLHRGQNISKKLCVDIALDIINGLEVLHEYKIVHRDLRSNNVLLCFNSDKRIKAKICDFGLSKIINLQSIYSKPSVISNAAAWVAPEASQKHSFAADIFSYGMVLWEIFHQQTPFSEANPNVITSLIQSGKRPPIGCDLFLISNFDLEKIQEMKGDAVILTNENRACFVKNGEPVMKDDKVQFVEKVERYGVPLCQSDELELVPESSNVDKIILDSILKGGHADNMKTCPKEIKDLIQRCWDSRPEKRPNIIQIKEMLWKLKETLKTDLVGEEDDFESKLWSEFKKDQDEWQVRIEQNSITDENKAERYSYSFSSSSPSFFSSSSSSSSSPSKSMFSSVEGEFKNSRNEISCIRELIPIGITGVVEDIKEALNKYNIYSKNAYKEILGAATYSMSLPLVHYLLELISNKGHYITWDEIEENNKKSLNKKYFKKQVFIIEKAFSPSNFTEWLGLLKIIEPSDYLCEEHRQIVAAAWKDNDSKTIEGIKKYLNLCIEYRESFLGPGLHIPMGRFLKAIPDYIVLTPTSFYQRRPCGPTEIRFQELRTSIQQAVTARFPKLPQEGLQMG